MQKMKKYIPKLYKQILCQAKLKLNRFISLSYFWKQTLVKIIIVMKINIQVMKNFKKLSNKNKV